MRQTLERVRHLISAHRALAACAALAAFVVAGTIVAATGERGTDAPAEARSERLLKGEVAPRVAPEPAADAVAGASMAGAAVGGSGVALGAPAQTKVAPAAAAVPGGPKIVKNSELRLQVAKGRFDRAFNEAASIAEANGGYVASSNRSTDDSKVASGDLVLRVKADRFDTARKALSALGTVKSDAIRGEDVTAQLVDFEARTKSLQAQEAALRTLLTQAKTVGEILPIQQQLFEVRQQIEQLQAQRQQLDASADLATIHVSVFEPGAAVKPEPEPRTGLAHDAARAWHGAGDVVGGMLVVLGYLSPIVLLALLVWGGLWLGRQRKRSASSAA